MGESQSEDVTAEAALNFLSEPLEGNSASLLHWAVEQYLEKECVGKFYGHLSDQAKKTNAVLEVGNYTATVELLSSVEDGPTEQFIGRLPWSLFD